MHVMFNDGSGHLAVAFPAKPLTSGEVKLTILDTEGSYYMEAPLRLTSNNPYIELKKYSDWFTDYKGIKTVTIYEVVEEYMR